MKPILLFATSLLSVVFLSCNSKAQEPQAAQTPAPEKTEQTENPYISKTQAQDTPAIEENLSGEVIVLSPSDFTDKITDIYDQKGFRYKGMTPCIVDFYANWCGPCRQIQPMMERMAKKYKGQLIIYKLNVDNAREICDRFGIQSIPTLMFFNRTEAPTKMVGAPTESELDAAITDFLNK